MCLAHSVLYCTKLPLAVIFWDEHKEVQKWLAIVLRNEPLRHTLIQVSSSKANSVFETDGSLYNLPVGHIVTESRVVPNTTSTC